MRVIYRLNARPIERLAGTAASAAAIGRLADGSRSLLFGRSLEAVLSGLSTSYLEWSKMMI